MSFWSTSTGENLASQTAEQRQEYTPAENNMEPIPAGSKVRAFIKEAKWDKTQDGDRYVKLRWDVVKPDEVARRVIFHKIWVKDSDPNAKNPGDKRDKALRMLAKIDALAGGKLAAKGAEPSDDELLVALADKQMVLCVELWEMEGRDGPMSGNWVRDVKPCEGTELVIGKAKEEPKKDANGNWNDLDDDLPF
jgi:hypothetical protein